MSQGDAHDSEQGRAQRLLDRASQLSPAALSVISDDELSSLLAEHRWAVGRLASRQLPMSLRTVLNAAVLKTHGLLYRAPRRRLAAAGPALRRVAPALLLVTAVFVGCALLTFVVVLADPLLASSLVPRELMLQIDPEYWGSRDSTGADLGMTLYYWSNNLRVGFTALSLGLLACAPALLLVGYNGVLLGAVAAVAVAHGAEGRLLSWIAPHIVPEIAGVILCGAVGWELGRSWLEPGHRRRRVALARAGRALMPMVVTAAALIICAAPLEGFVAPLELPAIADTSIALAWVVVLALLAWRVLLPRVGESAS